jgi:hypothetical protein
MCILDIDPMCLKDKADLEHEIAGKRKQITQLEGQFHKVAKQSDLIPIQKKIAADKSTIATTEIKYNALPCVIKNQCRVDKAELEAELAMAALRNLELQAQLIKGASESEQRKIYEQTESENRIIHHLTTNLKSVTQSLDHNLPCVPSGML